MASQQPPKQLPELAPGLSDTEHTRAQRVAWKVKEITVSGDIPSDTPEFREWLEALRRNDRSAKRIFGEYRIASFFMSGDGTTLHVVLAVQGAEK